MVLVVDDEPGIRMTLVLALQRRGHNVITAACGRDALGLLDAGLLPDVIVTDLRMPGINGGTLIEELRRRQLGAAIIVLSAYTYDVGEELRQEVAGIVSKPMKLNVLCELIEQWARPQHATVEKDAHDAAGT